MYSNSRNDVPRVAQRYGILSGALFLGYIKIHDMSAYFNFFDKLEVR